MISRRNLFKDGVGENRLFFSTHIHEEWDFVKARLGEARDHYQGVGQLEEMSAYITQIGTGLCLGPDDVPYAREHSSPRAGL